MWLIFLAHNNKAQVTGTGKAIFENLLSPEQVAHLDQVSHELQIRGQIVMPNSEVITTFKNISPYTVLDAFYTKMPLYYCEPEKLVSPIKGDRIVIFSHQG